MSFKDDFDYVLKRLTSSFIVESWAFDIRILQGMLGCYAKFSSKVAVLAKSVPYRRRDQIISPMPCFQKFVMMDPEKLAGSSLVDAVSFWEDGSRVLEALFVQDSAEESADMDVDNNDVGIEQSSQGPSGRRKRKTPAEATANEWQPRRRQRKS